MQPAEGAQLPSEVHLEDWVERNELRGEQLAQEFRGLGVVTDWNSSQQVAHWTYESAAAVNASIWQAKEGPVPITGRWETLLGES